MCKIRSLRLLKFDLADFLLKVTEVGNNSMIYATNNSIDSILTEVKKDESFSKDDASLVDLLKQELT